MKLKGKIETERELHGADLRSGSKPGKNLIFMSVPIFLQIDKILQFFSHLYHGVIKFFFSEHMLIKLNSGKSLGISPSRAELEGGRRPPKRFFRLGGRIMAGPTHEPRNKIKNSKQIINKFN